jgi:toxin YoeB
MYKIVLNDEAIEDMVFFASGQPKILSKIANLIESISKTPFEGIGKPEALKHDLAGFWSRRITDEHRLVYKLSGNEILIISCRFHYSNKK